MPAEMRKEMMNRKNGKNRKKKRIVGCLLLAAGLLGGCGVDTDATDIQTQEQDVQSITDMEQQEIREQVLEEETTEEMLPENGDEEKDAGEQAEQTEQEAVQTTEDALTEEELAEYTKWIQGFDMYGFLMSDWSAPEELNMWEVVYSGAGISEEASQEQVESYLARTEQEELYTEFFVIPKSSLDSFFKEKVGRTYDELTDSGNEGMEDAYDPAYDCFEMQVGDTNYTEFVVESGERFDGNKIRLRYRNSHRWEEYGWVEAGELEFVETDRQLLANHITEGAVLGILND